jgi:hypothetical protein
MASEGLPQIDMSYDLGKGFDSISELMRAMILRTIEDFQSGGELREEAIQYMMGSDEEYIFSFAAICYQLGLHPVNTRKKIMSAEKRISTRRRAA